jgi:hypothetical protein
MACLAHLVACPNLEAASTFEQQRHLAVLGKGDVIMKGKVFSLTVLSIAVVLLPVAGRAQTEPGCKSFQAIAQAVLPSSTPFALPEANTDIWGGPLFGMLGTEFVAGILSGNDGEKSAAGNIGQGLRGSYTVGLNCTGSPGGIYTCADTFTYEVPIAVWNRPPGFGRYVGSTARIVAGTGRFLSASGYLTVYGVFGGWPDAASRLGSSGRWNPELSGQICGVL